ncbi:Choline transport protein [Fusarium oxysporum f. sp. raphani]|uniref:Choline transport protein n=1 Tax=Fusarium oxysporum f. sp. raphani TaxID=96318 RepID=A0A8J5U613_FUSOX|nr:Choline transport protein [Fusarium oxysporum f. sp. raphani]
MAESKTQMNNEDSSSAHMDRQQTHGDNRQLESLGFHSELERNFSLPSIVGLCLCLMSTWEACAAALVQGLASGGAPCLFYNFIASFAGSLAIGASLGEIASIYPTAGGQYHWVTALAPARFKRPAGWFTGWISIGGLIALTSSPAFLGGLMTQALITLNDDTYLGTRWQGMLFYWAFVVYAAVMNVWGHRVLPTANFISGVLHAVFFLATLIVLAVMSKKNTAHYVFVETQNETGWSSSGVAWFVGMISSVYPFLGYDAACHLAEELPHASRNVPIAIMGSIGINGILGLAFILVLLFSSDTLERLLQTPTGFPFVQLYLDVTKSHAGTTILTIFIVLMALAGAVAGLTSTSRTLWAFARDDATPFSAFLSTVKRNEHVPSRAIWTVTAFQILLGFIYLGSSAAFNAILSMAIIGMYLSYLLPILAMLFQGRSKLATKDYGPFKLGNAFGTLVNIVSVSWIILVIVFSAFPSAMPVSAQDMNYSSVIIVGWMFFGVLYYLLAGHRNFRMPIVGAGVVMGIPLGAVEHS